MQDPLAESTARLAQLLREIMKETDPERYEQLAAEIWRTLREREVLKQSTPPKR